MAQPRGWNKLRLHDLAEGLHRGEPPERRRPRQHLVEQRSQGIDVGAGPDGLAIARDLLRGHVGRSTQDHSVEREPLVIDQELGQSEVGDLGRAIVCDQDIARVQVAVDDPALVSHMDRPGQRLGQPGRPAKRLGHSPEHPRQVPPRDILHGQKGKALVLADLEDLDDVGMHQLGGRLGLVPQPRPFPQAGVLAGQDHLERDDPAQAGLAGLVHDPHAPAADLLEDLVVADPQLSVRRLH